MKDYDTDRESSYLKYRDANNLYGWAMSQKLPINNFEWIKDTSQFNEETDKGYLLEVDVKYPKKLHEFHNDLPFSLERMRTEKVEKLVTNLHDKTKYVTHIRNL